MLICPHCKFENPDANKFCQHCGTSLIEKVCPKCATQVPVNARFCHNCNAECGTIRLAVIAKEGSRSGVTPLKDEEGNSGRKNGQDHEGGEVPSSSSPTLPLLQGSYLDPQQRYQLLEPLPTEEDIATNTLVLMKVLDCQPYQVSPLAAVLENDQKGLKSSSGNISGIPSLAKPYIALRSQCHLGIPAIHDAWQQKDMQVVLIEDRSGWQHLVELWREDGTSLLQIVHCFYQMTQLWGWLETVKCRQSVLVWSNLRLDEDQAVALQRLYMEEPLNEDAVLDADTTVTQLLPEVEAQTITQQEQPLTIKALGLVWQRLFKQSQRTQFGSVLQLLGDIELGKIQTLTELQSCLQAIATEMQSNATSHPQTGTASPTILQLDGKEESMSRSDDMPTVILPMQLVSLDNAGLTDVGSQRDHNEDYFGIETQIKKVELPNTLRVNASGLYILCDGMGGHAGGEVASALAVNTLQQYFQSHVYSHQLATEEEIREAVGRANQAIYDINQQEARSGVGRMGTTLVLVLIQDTQVAVAHVGDSRLYRLTRRGELEQVTTDHEVGQREVSRGVDRSVAYTRPDAYQLTQALGPRDENFISPDVQFFEVNEDTLFLLASDGLSDNDLLENHWRTHLEPLLNKSANLENGVSNLIDLANNYNGHDNITAVVIRVKVRPNTEQS